MNRRMRLLIAAMSAAVCLGLAADTSAKERTEFPPATPESQGIPAPALAELTAAVRAWADQQRIVGAELLVIKNRHTVLHKALGFADAERQIPMAGDTIFNVRSMTKPLTGTAAQILIDEGKLLPDAPVARYLPSFDNPRSRAVTVRHLLTHRSGLGWTTCLKKGSLRDIADCCGECGPVEFIPGTGFGYSSNGSNTLGAIIEKISGVPLDEFMTRRIFEPLGMEDTFGLHHDDARLARCACRYARAENRWERSWRPGDGPHYAFMRGAQGIGTTPLDYARFLAMWMDAGIALGRRIISEDAVRRALAPASLADMAAGFPDTRMYYGQQWMLYANPGASTPFAWGHAGSEGTFAWVWPHLDLMVLYFTQCANTETGFLLERMIDRLLIHPDRHAEDVPAPLQPYVGLYWCKEANMYRAVFIEDDRLVFEVPEAGLFTLRPTDEPDRWDIIERGDDQIAFRRDDAGRVVEIIPPASTNEMPHRRINPDPARPDIDDLMTLHLDGHGTAALPNLRTYRCSGRIQLRTLGWEGDSTFISDGDRRYRKDTVVPDLIDQSVVVNGERAWITSNLTGTTELCGACRERFVLARPSVVIGDWRRYYRSVCVVKRTCLDGEDVFLLRAVPVEAAPVTYVVHARTGLALRALSTVHTTSHGRVLTTVDYGDYRDVNGVKLPFRWELCYAHPQLGVTIYQYDTVETGLELPETFFLPDRNGTLNARPPGSSG